MHPTRHLAQLLILGACATLPAPATAQSAPVHAAQLEVGLAVALPVGTLYYDDQMRVGGSLVVRFGLSRGRFLFDAGVDAGGLRFNPHWFSRWIREGRVARLRAMLGLRYALVVAERAQLYARLGVGLEGRIGRYDYYPDDYPHHERDTSLAPVIEPSLGLRVGGAHHFALLQVAIPLALHRDHAIQPYGSTRSALAVDLTASIFVGRTL